MPGVKKDKKAAKAESGKPKRAMSAYFHWLGENRAKFATAGEKASETVKKASAAWRELSSSQKEPYEKMASDDKQRYEKEMGAFKAKE